MSEGMDDHDWTSSRKIKWSVFGQAHSAHSGVQVAFGRKKDQLRQRDRSESEKEKRKIRHNS